MKIVVSSTILVKNSPHLIKKNFRFQGVGAVPVDLKSSSVNHVKMIIDATNPILYISLKPGAQNKQFKSSQI